MRDTEIRKVIKEYLKDEFSKTAIMLNGEWGSGKTFFLNENIGDIVSKSYKDDQKRKMAYISLYGVKDFAEVSKMIIFQGLNRKGNGVKDKLLDVGSKLLSSTSISVSVAPIGIDVDLSKLSAALFEIELNGWLICFDDFERSTLPIVEVLGYINSLVESGNCKVIILANENEIGKIRTENRIEEKYIAAIGSLGLEYNKKGKSEISNHDQLKEYVQEIFSDDALYRLIKEKTIGITVDLEPNLSSVYETMSKRYARGEAEKLFEKQKEQILNSFEQWGCVNLRTLESVFHAVHKVYEMMNKHYGEISFFDSIMDDFVSHTTNFLIQHKRGKITHVEGDVSDWLKDKPMITFEFIVKYCSSYYFDENLFQLTVANIRKEKEEFHNNQKLRESAGAKLEEEWWFMEDIEFEKHISQFKEELADNIYPILQYPRLLARLLLLEKNGFEMGDIDEFVELMIQNVKNKSEGQMGDTGLISMMEDSELEKRFHRYLEKIETAINSEEKKTLHEMATNCLNSERWGKELYGFVNDNYSAFLNRHGFIGLLDLELLFDKIENGSLEELYNFIGIFTKVYVHVVGTKGFLRLKRYVPSNLCRD